MKCLTFDSTIVAIAPIEPLEGEARRDAERRTALELVRRLTGQADATIGHTAWGAPFIEQYPDISLSVSHSRRLAAVAIDPTRPIGLDIEEPREQLHRVASRFLAADELAILESITDREALTFELVQAWTIKEALVKISGENVPDLRRDLRALPHPAIRGRRCVIVASLTLEPPFADHHLSLLTP